MVEIRWPWDCWFLQRRKRIAWKAWIHDPLGHIGRIPRITKGFWAHSFPDVPIPHEADRCQERDFETEDRGRSGSVGPGKNFDTNYTRRIRSKIASFPYQVYRLPFRKNDPSGRIEVLDAWRSKKRIYVARSLERASLHASKAFGHAKYHQHLRRSLLTHQRHRTNP